MTEGQTGRQEGQRKIETDGKTERKSDSDRKYLNLRVRERE